MRILPLLFLVHLFSIVSGQHNPKIPLSLSLSLEERSNESVRIYVTGDLLPISSYCSANKLNFESLNSEIGMVELLYSDLIDFSKLRSVERIEPDLPVRMLMDSSLIKSRVVGVHAGLSPLNDAYTGKDVIIGVIDFGFYFDHKDFQKQDSSTRVRYIWDQTKNSGNAPIGYGYGEEWSWIDIDNGNCTHTEPANNFGHGTNVTGIAAGNGSANGKFKGVAPGSELILVALDGSSFQSNVVDAIDYIFKKADALAKPCVINTSVGVYAGSHDGKDLYSMVIEDLIEEQAGRAVVAAAGNAGNVPIHLGYDVSGDSSFTWFFENSPSKPIQFDIYSDTADFKDVFFSFGADNPSLFFNYGLTEWLNVDNDFEVVPGSPDIKVQSIYDQGSLIGQVWSRIEEAEGVYKLEVQIFPVVNSLYWRFRTKGSGRIDCWSNKAFTGSSNMVLGGLPAPNVMPEILTYKLPDYEQNMVSSWQCSPKVITVANYVNRTVYTDFNQNLHDVNSEAGVLPSFSNDLYPTSSFGPARTGIVKPDIAAPGSATLCTGNLTNINALLGSGQGFKVADGGLHNRNGGTSMASPVVAGIVALYLEKNPDAWWYEIKEVINSTAFSDSFTASVPNSGWGNGKVDAFSALAFPVVYGCTDSSAFNFDSLANVNDGSCQPVIYGCTDSLALNYNESANTDDGSCNYATYVPQLFSGGVFVYPNPAADELVIKDIDGQATFSIFSDIGKEVYSGEIHNEIRLNISNLASGMYYLKINTISHQITEKFIKSY